MSGTSLDNRVEDYLDDKFQSTTDLDSLDELLANIELQRTQLQTQLDAAIKELDEARSTADGRQGHLLARIEDFWQLQDSIDKRARVAAASDAPSEAIARLKKPMRALETVELTQKYLELLQDVERLRAEAREHLPGSPKAALGPYAKLKEMTTRMKDVEGSEELHIVEYVAKVTDALWTEMKETMSTELEAILAKRHWPRVDTNSEMDEEWMACFEKLIDLQIPEIVHSNATIPLLPVDVMAGILIAEFRFHFLSDKPTSSPQALATHCFPWFLTTIEKWEDFFRDNLSHLLASKFRETSVANNSAYVDPVCALVTTMLAVMQEKVQSVAQGAVKNPTFLSGFMAKLLSFDDTIRSRFNYDAGNGDSVWPGLSAGVLSEHFSVWQEAEKGLAMDRYNTIIESQDARKIDYDYGPLGRMKPTFAAVRIADLLRSVTTQYERLRSFRQKIVFFTSVQLDILDAYHERLISSLEAYQSITSTLGRTIHGATKEQLAAVEGTGALETLCKVIGSADHIVNTLTDWSDEEFFATLWDALQDGGRKHNEEHPLLSHTVSSIRDRVADEQVENEEGSLFDETIAAYGNRRKAAEELLVNALHDSHAKAFRAYIGHVQWTTVGETAVLDDPSQMSITPELDDPLDILKRNFDFLAKALSTACFRRVWRGALDKLQDLLWGSILLRQSFTTLGATQFRHDGSAIFSLIERYIPGGSTALDSLNEGMRLLSLPAEVDDENGGQGMSLKEASDRAFTDNDEARRVLEELQLESLTPATMRAILQRRVENKENIGW